MTPTPPYNPYAAPSSYGAPAAHAMPVTLASRGARLAADLIDRLIVMGPAFVLAFSYGASIHGKDRDPAGAGVNAVFWVLVLVGIAVQVVAQSRWSQSVGKRLLGIRVVLVDGDTPNLTKIIGRNLAMALMGGLGCGVLFLVDVLMIFGGERQCLHDRFAGTRVVVARE